MSDVEDQRPGSPPSQRRSRSRSPRRQRDTEDHRDRRDSGPRSQERQRDRDERPRPKKKNVGGFSYKDKRRDAGDDDREGDRRGNSYRGYRDRSRSPRRRYRDDDRGGSYKRDDRERDRDRGQNRRDERSGPTADTSKPPKRPAAKAAAEPAPTQGFIVVWVNDRLGTKEAIPCLPSDTVGQFKILVASRIGRKPHEIKLQKQGERPLKDMITLADYEISNGRQLDLEVGTGD